MKTIKDKQLLVGADFAGYPLKEAVCEHLGDYPLKLETSRNKPSGHETKAACSGVPLFHTMCAR